MKRGLRGWKIATIQGVDLKLHFSLIFLLIYVIIVASAQFPFVVQQSGIDPAGISGPPVLWAAVFAVTLFLSVVAHEFAHVMMAQSMGVKVEGVTLMMLGGVSEMERMPEERYSEFKVSIVGPLVSFAIALVLFGVRALQISPEVTFFSFWLARVNLVLAIFNLLPVFPLDGGRAFRSIVAARKGEEKATRIAVRVARGSAWVFGALGLLSFNFLLLLIAFFIYAAATSELTISVSRNLLRGMHARDLLQKTPVLDEDMPLREAADIVFRTRMRILPVRTREGDGAILSTDSLRRLGPDRWMGGRVSDAMERTPVLLSLDAPLDEHLPTLAASGALPVGDHGEPVGVVRYDDINEMLEFRAIREGLPPDEKRAA